MKKKLLLLFCTICCCLLTTSCYVTRYEARSLQKDYSDALVGKTHNDIVTQLGAPDRQTSDGSEGTILIYEKTTYQSTATAENVNYLTGTYTPGSRTTENTQYVHCYINKDGYCYGVKTNHQETVAHREKSQTLTALAWIYGGLLAFLGFVGIMAAAS